MSNRRKAKPSKEFQVTMAENKICSMVGQQLQKHYPGWHWLVECVGSTGVCTVKNLSLNGDYGFVIHLDQLARDTDLKLPVMAGGELLERCGFAAGPRPEDISHLHRDGRGNVTEKSADMSVSGGEY